LLRSLSNLNVASKEWVIRQYDHEVQAGSAVKPLVGRGAGPSDAAVLRPRLESERGIVLVCGICPELSDTDPYDMAVAAVDEAFRNVICVGGDPDRTAILDNFCWGGVDTPESLGALVRTCKGAQNAAVAYGLPFISGKDSLNNQFSQDAREAKRVGLPTTVSIPDTLLVSAISVTPDVARCVTMDAKRPGSRLVCVGGFVSRDLTACYAIHRKVSDWIRRGQVLAAHDVSDGGLLVAVAEMCIAGDLGASIDMRSIVQRAGGVDALFERQMACYVLECAEGFEPDDDACIVLGRVDRERRLFVREGERVVAEFDVEELDRAWRTPLAGVGGV
jgi:phosphoribosylformylglycinamidine synthase